MTAKERLIIGERIEKINRSVPFNFRLDAEWTECQSNGHTVKVMIQYCRVTDTVMCDYHGTNHWLSGYHTCTKALHRLCASPEAPNNMTYAPKGE